MEIGDQRNVDQEIKPSVEPTLFYGYSCYCKDNEKMSKTLAYDICQKIKKEEILNYKIHKIICKYVSNQYIATIKVIHKNRNNGEEVTLLETDSDQKDLIEPDIFELTELEEIISVRVWTNERLLGFEVKTNKNRIKKFGYGDENNLEKIDDLETGDKIVVGFGVYACNEMGVTSLFCYYIERKFHAIALNSGIFYLRAKIKKDNLNTSVAKEEDEKMYTLKKVCELSDVLFFEIMKFAAEK